MSSLDAETLTQQAVLLGLVSRQDAKEAKFEAEDGSLEAVVRSFLRRELLTRWQVDRLVKGEGSGYVMGGCKLLFHIAEGSFARVYRGVKVPGGQSVAIKVLRQRFASDAGAIERFNKEAEAGQRLIHPNIVRTYEYGEEDGKYFMIMEFVEGSNLRDFLKLRGRVTETEAAPLLLGLANALKYSLEHGVTHRDLKGTNILISSNGVGKLVDFGLATIDGEDKKMAAAHGQRTVDYSALERSCNSVKGDPRSDIFFLGCVFYQMLTGQLPLPEVETADPLAKMLKRGINSIKPLSEQRHAPSHELSVIIERMMKVDLRARYQSMDEVVKDLDRYLLHFASQPQPEPPVKKSNKLTPISTAPTIVDDSPMVSHDVEERIPSTRPAIAARFDVLCVEVQEEIQEAFRKSLAPMGYRLLLLRDAERAAERYREKPTDAVIFDVDGLGPNALDSFLEMHALAREDNQVLPAVVLLGPRQHHLAKSLPLSDRLVVLPKPIKMKQVQDAMSQILPSKP